MTTTGEGPAGERVALNLSLRDWLVTALLVTALLAVMPHIPFRGRAPKVEPDYRIPYALSTRYDLYRRYTALCAKQFPTILVGDSVVWGQCALRTQTLAHHLNELTKQPRFADAGLDGMHPIVLAELLEHHAPALARKDVVVQFDPLWMMIDSDPTPKSVQQAMENRPGLVPRLAGDFSGRLKESLEIAVGRWFRRSPLAGWAERLADTRMDFLAWSLDHPYESPLKAISAALPPSEDSPTMRLGPWSGLPESKLDATWPDLTRHPQWTSFEHILTLLERRGNRVLVLLGPMNEHMMSDAMRNGYQGFRASVEARLAERGVPCFAPPPLRSEHYNDICHPTGAGYEELARALLKAQSAWLLRPEEPR